MVIDWALEKISRHPHLIVDVSPCGENEQRLHIRSQACSASPTQEPRKGDTVCTLCWKAAEECLQKVATALIRQYAVAIYQHAVVGEHEEAADRRTALLKFEDIGARQASRFAERVR